MAPLPDRPDPSHDGDERPRDDGDTGPADTGGVEGGSVTDEQWAAIVADLRGEPDPTGSTDPGTADAAGQDDPRTPPGPAVTYPVAPWVTDPRVVRPARPGGAGDEQTPPRAASGRDWDATEQIDEAERQVDETEHFRPRDPGPVLGGDPLLTMAWLAVGGMPLVWLVVLVAWRSAPAVVMQASVVVFVLGLLVLLWRMPHRRDEEHDDSDGAVV